MTMAPANSETRTERVERGDRERRLERPDLMLLASTYLLAWLLPRWEPFHRNVLMRDDFVHLPFGHLYSYRPLAFLDLAFWNWAFGPEYLRTVVPKILAGTYLIMIALISAKLLLRWTGSFVVASVAPLLFLIHPI